MDRILMKFLASLFCSLSCVAALAQGNPALPPKVVEEHPRLAPLPAIHFDHFNTSVTDYALPAPGLFSVDVRELDSPTGICLNFLVDASGRIYGFCGESRSVFGWDAGVLIVAFYAVAFDDELRITDRYKLQTLSSIPIALGELPPLGLGYFVLDNESRLIVAKGNNIVFLGRTSNGDLYEQMKWDPRGQIRKYLDDNFPDLEGRKKLSNQKIAQIMPDHDSGYWIMALGESIFLPGAGSFTGIPAYLAKLDDDGKVQDVHVFVGETIENGMTIDSTGPYVVTDRRLYSFVESATGSIELKWQPPREYKTAKIYKPGTISLSGSGSTPTLVADDLIAITDNAENFANPDESQVNLMVYDRANGEIVCEVPLFEPGKSANENTVVSYGNSIVVQNWYGSPSFKGSLEGLKPGLERIDIAPDRTGCRKRWENEDFASSSTIRLSTHTGLLYAAVQVTLSEIAEDPRIRGLADELRVFDEHYAMGVVDFQSGDTVQKVYFGSGDGSRLSMAPAYALPDGRLIQPIRRGFVTFDKNRCDTLDDGWVSFYRNNRWTGKWTKIKEVAIPGIVEDFKQEQVGKGVSSVRWCLPPGVEFHAFSKPFLEGNGVLEPDPSALTYKEIKGTGKIEQADLRFDYPEYGKGGRHPMQDKFVSGWFADGRTPSLPTDRYPGIETRIKNPANWVFATGLTFARADSGGDNASIVVRREFPLPRFNPRIRAVPEIRVPVGDAAYQWMGGVSLQWNVIRQSYDWYVSGGVVVAEPNTESTTFDNQKTTWTASIGVEREFGHYPTPFFAELSATGEDQLYDFSILVGVRF